MEVARGVELSVHAPGTAVEDVAAPRAVLADEVQVVSADLDPLAVVGKAKAEHGPRDVLQLEYVLLGDNLGGNRQLFDLTLDPGEFENVADTSRANRKLAKELYQQVIEATGGQPLPYYDDKKLQAQLLDARARKGYEDPTP